MGTAGLSDGLQTGHIWHGHAFSVYPQPVVPARVRGDMLVAVSTTSSCCSTAGGAKHCRAASPISRGLRRSQRGEGCSPLPSPCPFWQPWLQLIHFYSSLEKKYFFLSHKPETHFCFGSGGGHQLSGPGEHVGACRGEAPL